MKNNGLTRLLAVTSCVAILAGCGKEDPKFVVKDLPESFHLGEVIDLDNYITVEGSSKSFEVSLTDASKNLASVEGHKITVNEEGLVQFSVKIGDAEQSVSFAGIAEMRDALIKDFAGYVGEYIGFGMYTGDIFSHRKEYAVRIREDYKTESFVRNGIVSPEGSDAAYEFVTENGIYYANSKPGTRASFEKLNVFTADIKGATRGKATFGSKEVEAYSLSSKSLKSFATSVMLTSPTEYINSMQIGEEGGEPVYGDVSTSISKVDFTMLESEGQKLPVAFVYGKINNKTTLIDAIAFTNDSKNFVDDPVAEYFVNDPSKFAFKDNVVGLLKSYFTQVLPYFGSFIAEYNYGWFDGKGNPIAVPSDVSGTYFEGLPVGSSKRVLSTDAIVTVVDEKIVSGVIQKTEAEVTTVYDVYKSGDNHIAIANPDYADVYENAYDSLAFIADSESLAFDAFYTSKTENVGTSEAPIYKFTLSPNFKRHYNFVDGICSCEDTISYLASFLYQYKEREFQKYFTLTFTMTLDSTNTYCESVHFEYSLNWDTGKYYVLKFDCGYDSTHPYDSLISDLFTEVFGS